jgi:hypothetical protein
MMHGHQTWIGYAEEEKVVELTGTKDRSNLLQANTVLY